MVALEEFPSRAEVRQETDIRQRVLRLWRAAGDKPDIVLPCGSAVWYVDCPLGTPWEYGRVILTIDETIVTIHDAMAARPSLPGITGDPVPEFVSRRFV